MGGTITAISLYSSHYADPGCCKRRASGKNLILLAKWYTCNCRMKDRPFTHPPADDRQVPSM